MALQVGSIVNFSLMYMLAKTPAQVMGAGSGNMLKALFDTNTLKRMGAPGTWTNTTRRMTIVRQPETC